MDLQLIGPPVLQNDIARARARDATEFEEFKRSACAIRHGVAKLSTPAGIRKRREYNSDVSRGGGIASV